MLTLEVFVWAEAVSAEEMLSAFDQISFTRLGVDHSLFVRCAATEQLRSLSPWPILLMLSKLNIGCG